MKHSVRIIGGEWKGRRLKVPSVRGLRPSPDAVRETLFNWIGSDILNARTVDLFAGTGALGFESLSRGAMHATFVETNRHALRSLRMACRQFDLHAERASIVSGNCLRWLNTDESRWDIAFVDPPFGRLDLYGRTLKLLRQRLTPDGLIYIEFDRRTQVDRSDWETWKSSTSGEVQFELLRKSSDDGCPANMS